MPAMSTLVLPIIALVLFSLVSNDTTIAQQVTHGAYLHTDGSIWRWGNNRLGQLGIGNYVNQTRPVRMGLDNDWIFISGNFAIRKNGTVWNLGGPFTESNSTNNFNIPTRYYDGLPVTSGLYNSWAKVYPARNCLLFMKEDSRLYSNCYNEYRGIQFEEPNGTSIGDGTRWSHVSVGAGNVHGIDINGNLWGWGGSVQFQAPLGDGTTNRRYIPVQLGNGRKWKHVSSGTTTFAIAIDGTLWATGYGYYRINDTGFPFYTELSFVQIGSDSDWAYVHRNALIKNDGSLWLWGENNHGQLGLIEKRYLIEPQQMGNDFDWVYVESNLGTLIAKKLDGSIWTWGSNTYDLLGTGREKIHQKPRRVTTDSDWLKLSTNLRYGIKKDGSLWGWDPPTGGISNANPDSVIGLLGDGANVGRPRPVRILIPEPVKLVSSVDNSTHAITVSGKLWSWGYSYLGDGLDRGTNKSNLPKRIGQDSDWTDVISQGSRNFAVKSNGTLWAWGSRAWELGFIPTINEPVNILSPRLVGQDFNWKSLHHTISSYYNGLAQKNDGTLWSWGRGCHGDDTPCETRYETPKQVNSWKDWIQVTSNHENSYGIRADRSLWFWGRNSSGSSGIISENEYFLTPTQVGNSKDWVYLSTYGGTVCATKTDGSLWVWGAGSELDKDWPVNYLEPRLIDNNGIWREVHSTGNGCMGVVADGSIWAWGNYPNIDGSKWDNVPTRVEFNFMPTGIDQGDEQQPTHTTLLSNYPNPFNPTTTIVFDLPNSSQVQLDIFDITGRKVLNVHNSYLLAGSHQYTVDASQLTSGVYLYRLRYDNVQITRKMTLLK